MFCQLFTIEFEKREKNNDKIENSLKMANDAIQKSSQRVYVCMCVCERESDSERTWRYRKCEIFDFIHSTKWEAVGWNGLQDEQIVCTLNRINFQHFKNPIQWTSLWICKKKKNTMHFAFSFSFAITLTFAHKDSRKTDIPMQHEK